MSVRKFRSVEEMPSVEWCETVDEECFRRIARLWSRSSAFSDRIYPRGVFKFKSLEEAQQARERVVQENVDRLRKKRGNQTL